MNNFDLFKMLVREEIHNITDEQIEKLYLEYMKDDTITTLINPEILEKYNNIYQ